MNVLLFRSALNAARAPFLLAAIAIAAAAILPISQAHADDYSDVNALVRAGKMSEALTRADQYLTSKPRDPQMRFLKGVIQTEAGKPVEAIATFTQITQDYPELPEPYNNLAVLYAGQSQFDKARAALEMAIRTNPSYATAHENLGDVYAKLASQAYSKALQLDSSNASLQPKLTLIRTLFAPDTRSQKPTPAAVAAAPAVAAPPPAVKTPTVVAAAPTAAPATAAATPVSPPVAKAPAAAAVPPAAAPTAALPAAATGIADKDIEAAVRAWAAAWASKDVGSYLNYYGKDFDTPGSQARKAWEDDRRARIVGKSSIKVQLNDLTVSSSGAKATARFRQTYTADTLNVTSRKTLELVKAGDRWVIVRESTG